LAGVVNRSSGADLGFPLTTELSDGTWLTTCYHIRNDGITRVAAARWTTPVSRKPLKQTGS
jgi:hypothetical protein